MVPERRNLSSVFLLVALLLGSALPLCAQEEENLDDLFSDPVADTVIVETQTDHLAQMMRYSFQARSSLRAAWPPAGLPGLIFQTCLNTLMEP